jgi:hypothetical protein
LLALAVIAAACGTAATPAPTAAPSDTAAPTDSAGPAGSGSAPLPDSPVAGIVTAVESAGLDQVKGFTLRTNDGETITFVLGPLENGDEFPPGHLKEHQAAGAPVLVFFRPEASGKLVVYRIEDAG